MKPTQSGPQIVFGWEDIWNKAVYGWIEYKTLEHLWGERKAVTGKESVYRIVLHEFAHVLTELEGGHRRGSIHNQCFARNLAKLIEEVPYRNRRNVTKMTRRSVGKLSDGEPSEHLKKRFAELGWEL